MNTIEADLLLLRTAGALGRLSPFSATLRGERQVIEDESTLGLRVALALNTEVK